MLVHFSAGMTVGMAAILVYWFFYSRNQIPTLAKAIKIALIGSAVIGIVWEIYELAFQMTYLSDGLDYYIDTASDLLMDTSGGILGALYAHRLLK